MNGMLSKDINQQPQSQGDEQLPPDGLKPASEAVPASADFEAIKEAAVQFMYGDRFNELLTLFKDGGAQGFARSVAVAINGAIDTVKKQFNVGHEQAAQLGMELYLYLVEDMLTGELEGEAIVKGITGEQLQDALAQTLTLYAGSNPDVTDEDMQKLAQEIQNQKGAQHGYA